MKEYKVSRLSGSTIGSRVRECNVDILGLSAKNGVVGDVEEDDDKLKVGEGIFNSNIMECIIRSSSDKHCGDGCLNEELPEDRIGAEGEDE